MKHPTTQRGLAALANATADNVVAALVLARSGLLDVRHPGVMLQGALDLRAYGPIVTPMRLAAKKDPERVAIIDEHRSLTYAELDRTSDALANAFLALGLDDNHVVGTLCRDHAALVETMMATGKAGARLVLLNTSLSPREIGTTLEREKVDLVVVDSEFAALLAEAPSHVRRIQADPVSATSQDPSVASLIRANAGKRPPPRPQRAGALVVLTGGTTGTPKGAERTVKSPLAAAQFFDRIPLPSRGTTFLAAPLFHGTALSQFLLSMSLSSTIVLRQRFDPEATLAAVDQHGCTTLVLVPTMLRRILNLPAEVLNRYDTSSLQVIFCAGSALPVDTGNAAMKVFGPVLYNLYGTSEVGVAAVATPEDWARAPGSVGKPPRSTRVQLFDDTQTLVTQPGVQGTIYVGSSLSFQGYSTGEGKHVINGLLSSGDVGHWDREGHLFIDGRDDDMIVSGGENLFPGEIEDLLYSHHDIDEAAVIAVPDDDFGQRLAAFVVLRPGSTLDADGVRQWVREHLAKFKVPRDVVFVEQLPRTPTGKLLRRTLGV